MGNTSIARPIYATTVSLSNLILGAGSHWFSFSQTGTGAINSPVVTTLVNGVPQAIAGNSLVNDGTSWIPTPYQPLAGTKLPTIRPELAFLVNGTVNAPEPGSLALLVLPMAASLGLYRFIGDVWRLRHKSLRHTKRQSKTESQNALRFLLIFLSPRATIKGRE